MSAFLCVQAASAQEYRGSLKDGPAIVEGYNWSGFYGGLNAGYTWDNWDWPGANPYIAPPKACGDCGPPNQSLSGAMLGGTVGYNYQIERFVIGIEGDFDFGNIKDAQRDGNYLVETSKIQDFATIRARAGLLLTPALLVYATGGVAFENLEYGESCPGDASAVQYGWCLPVSAGGHGPYALSKSQWNTGYVVGGGVEWMVARQVSFKIEGLYADFGTNDYQLGNMADGKPLPLKKIDNDAALLKVGINYHF
jgi:outer membrane immunogenic protein